MNDLEAREFIRVSQLMQHRAAIFVFGSNEAGVHGGGAALVALNEFGARYGEGVGLYGRSYAIPTKDREIETLPLNQIEPYVRDFILFANRNPQYIFAVTRIGCGLAGYTDKDIAPMFVNVPPNCRLPEGWRDPVLDAVLARLGGDYTEVPDADDTIMTVEEFRECVRTGLFIDYDVHGRPMLGGLIHRARVIIPSKVEQIPDEATHIVWYNR